MKAREIIATVTKDGKITAQLSSDIKLLFKGS
jgi:hypothetical protein